MEANPQIILELKRKLPGDDWLWVLAGLKHDKVIWQSLSDPAFIRDALTKLPSDGEKWSPANLALLTFEQSFGADDLTELPLQPVPEGLRTKVIQTYKSWRKNGQYPGLYQAGLLALALREHRRIKDTWHGFDETLGVLDERWLTPLACVYGMIPDPEEMLLSILSSREEGTAVKLALHALLSNPAPMDQHLQLIERLLVRLPETKSALVISEFSLLHPKLAARLAELYLQRQNSVDDLSEGEPLFNTAPSDQELVSQIENIRRILLHSKILGLTEKPRDEAVLLDLAQKNTRKLLGHLAARYAASIGKTETDCDSQLHQMMLNAWQKSIELTPETTDYAVKLAIMVAECDQEDSAFENIKELQTNERYSDNLLLNLSMVRLSEKSGDLDEGLSAALRAFEQVQKGDSLNLEEFRFLAQYLFDRNMLPEASVVAIRGLQTYPLDSSLLTLVAQTALAHGDPNQALPYVALALGVEQQEMGVDETIKIRPELLELWIISLEKLGAWELALQERMDLLSKKNEPTLEDLHALSNCALRAGDIQQAIRTSQSALEIDPDDGDAHGLLGNALLASGETESALQHYHFAVRSTPSKAEWWLALAELYRQLDRKSESLETLRSAAQAVPDSSGVRLALGEAYLLVGSPTLALDSLRYAARLDDSPRTAYLLGQALHQLGHLEEARQVLQRAYLAIPPGIETTLVGDTVSGEVLEKKELYSELACLYARVLSDLEENTAAIPVLENAVKIQPDNPEPRLLLAKQLMELDAEVSDLERAIYILTPVLENKESGSEGKRFEALVLVANVYAKSGKWQQAVESYQTALGSVMQQRPEWQPRLAVGLGRASIQSGQPELAIEALRKAELVSPDDADVQKTIYEVCAASELFNEAYEAAKKFYELRSSDFEALVWYVEQAIRLAETEEGLALGTRQDAIDALKSGLELAPENAFLHLRLGELYLEQSEYVQAQNVLHKFNHLPHYAGVDLRDMIQVARSLLSVGMKELSADTLQRCLEIYEEDENLAGSPDRDLELHLDLSTALQESGDLPGSLKILENGKRLFPDQSIFYQKMSGLLLELDRYDDARGAIAAALRIDPEDAYNHYQKANIERLIGDIPIAYYHAVQSICYSDEAADVKFLQKARLQAAQLAELTLRPSQAQAYLWDEPVVGETNENNYLQSILRLELALGRRDLLTASNLIDRVVALAPSDTRTLAAEARWMRLQGDKAAGKEKLDAVMKSINFSNPEWNSLKPTAYKVRVACCRSGCRAAWEYGDWENAYYWACLASEYGIDEPLSNFLKSQILTSRAEAARKGMLFDLQKHSPDEDALSEYARNEFQKVIQEVEKQVDAIGVLLGEDGNNLWGDEAYDALVIWRARGYAAFEPTLENATQLGEILKKQTSDDPAVAALILAFVGAGEPAKAVQMVRAEWSDRVDHPLISAHLALALAEIDENQAYQYALSALNSVKEGGCPDCPDEPVLAYLVSRLAYKVGDQQSALSAIEQALEVWPDEARWQAYAASIQLDPISASTGEPSSKGVWVEAQNKAIGYLERAASLEPDYAEHHVRLGTLYRQGGDLVRAIASFEHAARLEPDQPTISYELAQTQMVLGDLHSAEVNAAKALSHSPDDLDILMLNAQIAFNQEDYEGALRHLKSVIGRKEDHPHAMRMVSEVLDRLGRTEEALVILERAMPLFGYPMEMQLQQVRLIYRARGYEAALPSLENLINRFPDEPELLVTMAEWKFQNGEGKKAVDLARTIIQDRASNISAGQHADLNYLMGLQARQDGQLDQAVHYLSEAVALAPDHLEALIALGRTHQTRRELREAWKVYQRAIEVTESDYRPYYHAGQVLKDLKDYPQAEKMLRHAAQIAPDEVLVHRLLGAVTVLNLVHNR